MAASAVLVNALNNANQDPDVNLFHNNLSSLNKDYISPQHFKKNFKDFSENSLYVLHLNMRSLDKNFEYFKEWPNDENIP